MNNRTPHSNNKFKKPASADGSKQKKHHRIDITTACKLNMVASGMRIAQWHLFCFVHMGLFILLLINF